MHLSSPGCLELVAQIQAEDIDHRCHAEEEDLRDELRRD